MLHSGYSVNNKNNRGIMSLEARIKLSNLYTGKIRDRKIVEKSIKNRQIESERRGYFMTEETKLKISKSKKNKKVSSQERLRLIEIRKLVTPHRSPILSLNLNTNKVQYFNSITEASLKLNCQRSNISKVLAGKRNSTSCYYFCKVDSTCPLKIG